MQNEIDHAAILGIELVQHRFDLRPTAGDVDAPAPEFGHVRRNKGRRVGVLGFADERFEQTTAFGLGHSNEELRGESFRQTAICQRGRGQRGQSRSGQHRVGLKHRGGAAIVALGGGSSGQDVNRVLDIDPGVKRGSVEAGGKINLKGRLFFQRRQKPAGLAGENFLDRLDRIADEQERIRLAECNFQLVGRCLGRVFFDYGGFRLGQ